MTEVVAALIWDQDKFMICQRPAHKARGLLWEFVGGKVEPGETKEQALIRECQEELAITLDVGEVFMDVTHEYPDLTVHLTSFLLIIRKTVAECLPVTRRSSGVTVTFSLLSIRTRLIWIHLRDMSVREVRL